VAALLSLSNEVTIKRHCNVDDVKDKGIDKGIGAFSGSAEKEKEKLISVIEKGGYVTIAYTLENVIVGFISLDKWTVPAGRVVFETIYELVAEVSKEWRGRGIAFAMLTFTFEDPFFDDKIVIARGISSYWDLTMLEKETYRRRLLNGLKAAGFVDWSDNNPFGGEFLAVRIGSKADPYLVEHLDEVFARQASTIYETETVQIFGDKF